MAHHNPQYYRFYSYNTEGQPAWQLQQFNANGITTDARGLTVRLDYANYDLMGNLRTVNVDVNHDMQLDMQQHYVYDAWGRLKDVYLNLGDDTDSGERIASYTYDDALGLMTSTKYHRSPCDVPGQNEVIEVTTNTYDVRDRLTGITGNRYAETLYYDGALPVHPVAGTCKATSTTTARSTACSTPTCYKALRGIKMASWTCPPSRLSGTMALAA
ncbi:MAG: hypothetical protein IPH63_07925 [Flavobacteriales bacterium]|nr:hypothetical protein [Flavobacteriales bacterium]